MPRFDQEDVINQRRDGQETAIRLQPQIHGGRVVIEPHSPLAALLVRIGEQLVERQRDHRYIGPRTCSGVNTSIGPRFSALILSSMTLRSPTTTTANLSGWTYCAAVFCTS